MTIFRTIILYVLTAVVFFAVDMVWLNLVAKDFYQNNLGHLLGEVNQLAAIVFYLIYIGGIMIFGIMPALEKRSLSYALVFGSLFGFYTYATYDLTNLATLKDWPLKVVLVDIVWGTFLCFIVSTAGYYIGTWITKK